MVKFVRRKYLDYELYTVLKKKLAPREKSRTKYKPPKRILCLQMNSIGDTIMTQPSWTVLKKTNSSALIDLICRPHIAPLFSNDPAIHRVYAFTIDKYRSWRFTKRHALQELFKNNYDLIVDFTALPLTALFCRQNSTTMSIGFQRKFKLFNKSIDLKHAYWQSIPYSEKINLRDLMDNLIRILIPDDNRIKHPVLYVYDDVQKKARQLLFDKGLGCEEYVILHPGAKWCPKRWPIGHWCELVSLLKENSEWSIVIMGGPDDRQIIDTIARNLNGNCARAIISDALDVSSAIIKNAKVCICNDSAPMHIASAVGRPCVAIFGPVSPQRSAPPIGEGCFPLHENMFCSPCQLYYSKDRCRRGLNFCMHTIKPTDVLEKINELID